MWLDTTLRRTLRAVRPNPKRWYGSRHPRSWTGLVSAIVNERLTPGQLLGAVEILQRGRKTGRFLATLPRAGSNYLTAILTSASEVEQGHSGEYSYLANATPSGHGQWVHETRLFWTPIPGPFAYQIRRFYRPPVSPNMFLGSHHPLNVGMLDPTQMKPVLVVRELFETLSSWMKHAGFTNDQFDAFWDRGIPEMSIRYFNFWGEFLEERKRTNRTDHLCIRYENLLADPMPNLRAIRDLWRLEISDQSLQRALELNARERMESKAAEDPDNKRVSIGDRIVFDEAAHERILTLIRTTLRYDFGYVYH